MPTITTQELTTQKIAKRHHYTVKSRLAIVQYATEYGIKGAARRFGLDRKTVRVWRRSWEAMGLAGIVPRYLPILPRRIANSTVALIEEARRDLHFGASAPASGLSVCIGFGSPLRRFIGSVIGWGIRPSAGGRSGVRRQLTLFSRERPGDCVQMDVKEVKIAGTKCFQYTAIDDCTRYRDPPSLSAEESADQPHVLDDHPDGTPISHPKTAGGQRHRIPAGLCAHSATGRDAAPRYQTSVPRTEWKGRTQSPCG